MFIVWGTKIRQRDRGYVAEFCPSCQLVTTHQFREVRAIGHLYYISFGSGKVVGHDVRCLDCKDTRVADELRYATVLDDPAPAEEMMERTTPQLLDEMNSRLEQEERQRSGNLGPDERLNMIAGAFMSIAATVQQRAAETVIDRRSGLSMVALVVIPVAILIVAFNLPTGSAALAEVLKPASGIIAAVIFIYMLYCLLSDVSRFIHRQYWRFLINELRRLDPTLQEIKDVLKILKKQKLAVGRQINASKLHGDIAEANRFSAGQ